MRQLIEGRILPSLNNEFLRRAGDAAILPRVSGQLALTTDSFVVSPLFFPGGDIGKLAVYGTTNDLAVAGAFPRWISLSLIIEDGFKVQTLERVLQSIAKAAQRVGVHVVTGDTKVVPRGAVDQLFINTTGVGEFVQSPPPGPEEICEGDAIIVSGPIGCHGIAVMSARERIDFDPAPQSDCAPLTDAMSALRRAAVPIKAARDATRGGVGTVLHEWAQVSGKSLVVDERLLPVLPEVRGACELLGLDPIHVANEGTMVLAVPSEFVDTALDALRRVPETTRAARIGFVQLLELSPVLVSRGSRQLIPLDEPAGAPLPRIC
jgi:hydrogenase expression/formation protein HypE